MGSKPWIELDFCQDDSLKNATKSSKRKFHKCVKTNTTSLLHCSNVESINFDVFNQPPKSVDNLFVNKAKLREIENGLKNQNAKFILLTGPSGCGKTVTVDLMAREMGFCVDYWSNDYRYNLKQDQYGSRIFQGDQIDDFLDFLSESSRNVSLFPEAGVRDNSNLKLIVVDEYPVALMKNLSRFWHRLTYINNRKKCGQRFKILFICNMDEKTDSANVDTNQKFGQQNLNFRKIFPDSLPDELNFLKIKMNPFTPRNVASCLRNLVTSVSMDPSRFRKLIEQISENSNGDMRSAILALDIALHSDEPDLQNCCDSSSNTKDKNSGLFSCLGKILYSKRRDLQTSSDESSIYDQILPPMSSEIEHVFDMTGLSYELFLSYLHANYLPLIRNSDDNRSLVARICNDLSLADYFTKCVNLPFDARERILPYAVTVSGRSLAFYMHFVLYGGNSTSTNQFKFSQMCKPTNYSNNQSSAAQMKCKTFATDLAPYLCKLGCAEENVVRLGSFNVKFRSNDKAFIASKPTWIEQMRLQNHNESIVNGDFECDISEFDD
uniref:AAA+ ATPase domain-containing protein n=1 Tax=Romanomermis culicivorax TaxID=13658 RepID=A0A915JSL8_ROMCU